MGIYVWNGTDHTSMFRQLEIIAVQLVLDVWQLTGRSCYQDKWSSQNRILTQMIKKSIKCRWSRIETRMWLLLKIFRTPIRTFDEAWNWEAIRHAWKQWRERCDLPGSQQIEKASILCGNILGQRSAFR